MLKLWEKIKGVASTIGVFGLNSFVLLLLKNQFDRSRVYLICVITVGYIGLLIAEHRLFRGDTTRRDMLTRRTRLTFRWIYVAVYITIIITNIQQERTSGAKLVFQIVMCVIIALTVPRDMLWRWVKPIVLNWWSERKFRRRGSNY
ncbi:MAG: hypothetical protein LBN30_03780 [Oscillospiraceae bacterium]|jgi:hypothetical protein|nr:hypothetical protein [Oscillospiraceae bacterium]